MREWTLALIFHLALRVKVFFQPRWGLEERDLTLWFGHWSCTSLILTYVFTSAVSGNRKYFVVIFKLRYFGSTFPVEFSIIRSTISLKTNSDLKVNVKNFWCNLCVFSLSTSAHREVQHSTHLQMVDPWISTDQFSPTWLSLSCLIQPQALS